MKRASSLWSKRPTERPWRMTRGPFVKAATLVVAMWRPPAGKTCPRQAWARHPTRRTQNGTLQYLDSEGDRSFYSACFAYLSQKRGHAGLSAVAFPKTSKNRRKQNCSARSTSIPTSFPRRPTTPREMFCRIKDGEFAALSDYSASGDRRRENSYRRWTLAGLTALLASVESSLRVGLIGDIRAKDVWL